MLPKNLAFVDIETTGGSIYHDHIIDIGILRVENNVLVKTYQTLINPQCYLPPEITLLTGVEAKDLESAPTFRQIKDDIFSLLQDCVFVAHNVRFDYGFLKQEFRYHNIPFSPKQFCTVKLSRKLFPTYTHHNLDALIERFSLPCENRHRAFSDANAIYIFYEKVKKMFSEEILSESMKEIMKKPSLPIKLPANTLDSLPEFPGVYIFYGENGMPLYVGKSVNIRERVLSHFSADQKRSTEMKISQQIESIETIVTAGELGALLKESMLIKKLQPLYNRQLRYGRKIVVLKQQKDADGFMSVSLEQQDKIALDDLPDIIGIFKSLKQAKTFLEDALKTYALCNKLLGLEKTAKECFSHRLERCKGACIGKENPLFYNTRFITAFAKNKIRQWPFKGPIAIEETTPGKNEKEIFVIDKWCLLGNATFDESSTANFFQDEYSFDVDTYRILNRFLAKESNIRSVKQLPRKELDSYMEKPMLSF